jgi:hypothetical protein
MGARQPHWCVRNLPAALFCAGRRATRFVAFDPGIQASKELADGRGRQLLPLRGVIRQELEMPKDRPSLAFFALIAASLCAAVVLIALLIAGDVAGPRVAMNNSLPHSQGSDRQ